MRTVGRSVALVLGLVLLSAACTEKLTIRRYDPPPPAQEIPDGGGLFTGKKGKFDIYNQ